MKSSRFIRKYYESNSVSELSSCFEIWVDTVTGVNYILSETGITALVDKDGKVIISEECIESDIGGFKTQKK